MRPTREGVLAVKNVGTQVLIGLGHIRMDGNLEVLKLRMYLSNP